MQTKGTVSLSIAGCRAALLREQQLASAIAQADEVLDPDEALDIECLCCRRRVPLSRIVVFKSRAGGCSGSEQRSLVGGVCSECTSWVSEGRRAEVAELVRAAAHVESLLSLVRHRAEQTLSGWWGTVGACTTSDIESASVALRRAIERIGER